MKLNRRSKPQRPYVPKALYIFKWAQWEAPGRDLAVSFPNFVRLLLLSSTAADEAPHLHEAESVASDNVAARAFIIPGPSLLKIERRLRRCHLQHFASQPANKVDAHGILGRESRNGDGFGLVDRLPVVHLGAQKGVALLLHIVVDDTRNLQDGKKNGRQSVGFPFPQKTADSRWVSGFSCRE